MEWDRAALEREGFVGWCVFRELRKHAAAIPREAGGVYIVYRPHDGLPAFLESSPAGTSMGDPTTSVEDLEAAWVSGARVLNIAKANPGRLRDRMNEYEAFGRGKRSPHGGGRSIWQLADVWDCLVAWRVTDDGEDPRTVERAMIVAFQRDHGKRPFANRNG